MASTAVMKAEIIPPKAARTSGGGVKGKEAAAASAPEGKRKANGPPPAKHASDSKHKSPAATAKPEAKGKPTTSSSKTITKTSSTTITTTKTKTTVRTKAAKKVFTLSGQKYDPPEEREPLRIFYESLSKQIPSSEMAEVWMMEHGLLFPERAKKAYERKQRRQQQLRTGTPVKSPIKSPRNDKPESSKKPQIVKNSDVKAKKRVNYSDDNDDFIAKPKKFRG